MLTHLVPNYEREVRKHDCIIPDKTASQVLLYTEYMISCELSSHLFHLRSHLTTIKHCWVPKTSDIQLSLVLQTLSQGREMYICWCLPDKVTSCEYMIIQSNLDWSLQTAPH